MRRNLQLKAWLLLLLFLSEIFSPMHLMALGSGPSQPEMAGFTPAGTTEMVDPFTGDFTYNIPLMDVEGYPINIAYNSGVSMEQEASWVGLGWNLNVGTINRSVRGLPDDYKGDAVTTETSMKPMSIIKVGGSVAVEVFGLGGSTGITFIHNNYKGFGLALDNSIGASLGPVSANVGASINSLDGTSVNSSLRVSLESKQSKYGTMSFGGSLGTGFNTRTGQTTLTLGTTAGYSSPSKSAMVGGGAVSGNISANASSSTSLLPIGMDTYTPYPSLKLKTSTYDFSGSIGPAVMGANPQIRVNGSITKQEIEDKNVSTPAYGYLYAESANGSSLKDFNREKQAPLNKTTTNLSPVNFTYDVYSVSGQGVSGMFRPFRNDVGLLSDQAYSIKSSDAQSFGGEYGGGLYFKGGVSYNRVEVDMTYGPWYHNNEASYFRFGGKRFGSSYENVYFKAAGDKAEADLEHFNQIGNFDAYAFELQGEKLKRSIKNRNNGIKSSLVTQRNSSRAARSKVFSYLTADLAQEFALDEIRSMKGEFHNASYTEETPSIPRVDGTIRKAHHISEITQTNPDGERYVFGIPAYNNVKKEVTYNTKRTTATIGNNKITPYHVDEPTANNEAGIDWYFSKSTTPSYAHSYLLTAKLSEDYQDVTGNGVSPDDIGNGYKFDYTRTSSNYKWRIPYGENHSTFMEGYRSNDLDQKGSYTYGEKEMWYLNTIQSKNQVAEFHISTRKDALGVKDENGGKPTSLDGSNQSYKLDEIVLYNKLDRLENGTNATPIKRVKFFYDYSLCKNVENNSDAGLGKLTLTKVEVSYGKNDKGKDSPYTFTYGDSPADNPNYQSDLMDRWGNYKLDSGNPGSMYNSDFPYVPQNNASIDTWAAAWSLSEVKLPSGGSIEIEYEADDYGYVQQKDAMQMFSVLGAGNSSAYNPTNTLYDNPYLYITLPPGVSTDGDPVEVHERLKELFFGAEKKMAHMYFKFLTSIGSGKNEYATGYVTAEDIGLCDGSTNKLYIKLKEVGPNPITQTAWGYFRQSLFEVLYKQPNVNNTGVESVVRGILANVADIRQMFTGVEKHLRGRNIANSFDAGKSFIRLNSPTKIKKGGGSRVKRIVSNDNWQDISGEGENSTYGQEYFYTTTDKFGRTISSGVASYEPMIGNDENPFREPVYYTATESAGHIPAIEAFQERPFGESFFPSASVGYSHVTVKNIHHQNGKTAKAITEHKFYTAKDFPVIRDEVVIQKVNNPASKTKFSFPFKNDRSRSFFGASQGYSIVLNDMHGKPLSTKNYMLEEVDNGGELTTLKKLLGGEKFNYRYNETANGKRLSNKVQVLTKGNLIEEKLLGVEYDLAVENRSVSEKNTTVARHLNVDIFPIPFPLAPIPLVVPNANSRKVIERKESRQQVLTKVIQQYGLIESVETFTDQYSTTTYNTLYDGTTGDVLLTETKDEHKQNEFQFNIPAYSVQGNTRMGPAYQRIGIGVSIAPTGCTLNNPNNSAFIIRGSDYLTHGDEVMVKRDNGSYDRAWVLIDSNRHEIPVFLCDTSSPSNPPPPDIVYPYIPTYRRLMTTFQHQAFSPLESVEPYKKGKFKKDFGEIMKEVEIYHLKSAWAAEYDTALIDLVKPSICEIVEGPTGYRAQYMNHIYHSKECAIAKTHFYDEFGLDDNGDTTIFHPKKNYDLSREISSSTQNLMGEVFDLSDPMTAKIELLEAELRNDSLVSKYQVPVSGGKKKGNGNELHRVEDSYRVADDPCLELEDYYSNILPYTSSRENVFYNGYNTSRPYRWAFGIPNYPTSGDHVDTVQIGSDYHVTISYQFNVNMSNASFRIKDKESFQPYLAKKEQLYLIRYEIKDKKTSQSRYAYFVENGRGFKDVPNQIVFNDRCASEDDDWGPPPPTTVVDSVEEEIAQKPCRNNYFLMDRSGNYMDASGISSVTILRPAERNRLNTHVGSILSKDISPLKIQGGQFVGFLDETQVDILQANTLLYKEGQRLDYSYPNSNNPFVNGALGSFREDSLMRYVSSRHQAPGIELSQDGYMETLPELWARLPCYQNLFPPDYKQGGGSSGWKLKEKINRYKANGQAVESENALGIPSAQLTDYRGMVELVASYSEQQDVAYDNFEGYFEFGVGTNYNKANFRLIPYSPSHVNKLNVGNDNYWVSNSTPVNLVEGIAHTGKFSMYVNRDQTTPSTINITYDDGALNTLEQLELSEGFDDQPKDIANVNVSNTRTAHLNAFKSGLPAAVQSDLNTLVSTTNPLPYQVDFQLAAGDSNGVFKPQNGRYVLSVWVKEILATGTLYAGESPEVQVTNNGTVTTLKAAGPIIDGWQKVEGSFEYTSTSSLEIKFTGGIWGAFYDDFRLHPTKSNVNTYVFDRYLNRLEAKLDENNYATFYDYDEANIPSQVKRETEQGILTVSESRQSTNKH